MASNQVPSLLSLPVELRYQIFDNVLCPDSHRITDEDGLVTFYKWDIALFHVNRQISHEARYTFLRLNKFVVFETPWREAEEHLHELGGVAFIATDTTTDRFPPHYARIVVESQLSLYDPQDYVRLMLHVDQLERLARTWSYSNLTYGNNLNMRLALHIYLNTPPKLHERMTRQLQKTILSPFGLIKRLARVEVHTESQKIEIQADIVNELRTQVAEHPLSPEQFLELAIKLQSDGDDLAYWRDGVETAPQDAKVPDYRGAIAKYIESFRALLIVCEGRRRIVWGETYFDCIMSKGIYKNCHGYLVRLILRIQLVAAITRCYFNLSDIKSLKMANFWGMRTITTVREHLIDADDHPSVHFPIHAREAMSQIYLWTGLAQLFITLKFPGHLESEEEEAFDMFHLLKAARCWQLRPDAVRTKVNSLSAQYQELLKMHVDIETMEPRSDSNTLAE